MKTVRAQTSLAAILIAGLLPITSALAADPPSPAANSFLGGRVEVSFTKWVTTLPNMAGVVSGDVSGGTFVGEVLGFGQDGNIATIHALYHINGGTHSFTADNVVTQDNAMGTAVINGTVISEGPLKGARVQGEYQVIFPCGIVNAQDPGNAFHNVCFQGTLDVRPGLTQ
jgi:hypothetical protein